MTDNKTTRTLNNIDGLTELEQSARVGVDGVIAGNASVNMTLAIEDAKEKFYARTLKHLLNNSGEDPDNGSSDGSADVSGVNGAFAVSNKAEYDKFKAELTKEIKEGGITFQTNATEALKQDLICLGMIQLALYLKLAGANIKGSWGFGVMEHSVNVSGKSNMSRHKYGVAIDISVINGKHISNSGAHCTKLVEALARIVQPGSEDGSYVHEFLAPIHVVAEMKKHDPRPASCSNNSDHNDHLHFSIPKKYGLKNGYTSAGSKYNSASDTGPGPNFYIGWIFEDYAHYESIRDGKDNIDTIGNTSSTPPNEPSLDAPASEIKAWTQKYVAEKYKWTGDEWLALVWIINHESSWNPRADNPKSSAMGLFQKMESIHGKVEKTVKGQVDWGCNYIKSRYKTPTGAKAFWKKNNWY